MPRGAPRTVSLPEEEMIALGKEMVAWVKANDPLHLSAWYSIEKMFTEKQWEAFIQIKEFLPYYEQALKVVGQKYLDRDSNVREGISQRWQRVYFKDIRAQEDKDHAEKLERELQKKLKEIEFETKQKQINEIPALADTVDLQNRIMELEAELKKFKGS